MNKQKKQTIIIVIVLAVLIGVYFLIDLWPQKSETPVDTHETLLAIDTAGILSLDFTGSEEQLTFTRESSEGNWVLKGYEDREVEASTITTALNSCCNLDISTKLEDVTDYSQFGFDEPKNKIIIKTASETHEITFGSYNSAVSAYYLMVDSDPAVYVFSATSSVLPFDYVTDHYLVALPEEDDDADTDTDATNDSNTDNDETNTGDTETGTN